MADDLVAGDLVAGDLVAGDLVAGDLNAEDLTAGIFDVQEAWSLGFLGAGGVEVLREWCCASRVQNRSYHRCEHNRELLRDTNSPHASPQAQTTHAQSKRINSPLCKLWYHSPHPILPTPST